MKNLSTILSILAFIGVCILGFFHLKGGKGARKARVVSATPDAVKRGGMSIAYVDLDTLEENYTFFKKKKAEFDAQDKKLGNEIDRLGTALQNEYIDLQKKAQAGTITQDQGEAIARKLQQRQQELEIKKQNDGSQLIKEQEKFNKKLQEDIRGFLEEFADEKGYDFVLAYTKTSTILFANPDLDITQEVIDALNSGKSYGKKNDKESDEKTTTDTVTKKSEMK